MSVSCFRPRAVGVDSEDIKIGPVPANEGDQVSARRPDGKVVPLVGQNPYRLIVEIHDAQAVGIGAGGAIDNMFAVGPKGCERIVAVARCEQVEAGAVGIHDAHLRAAIDRIDRPLCSGVEVKERSEATDADNNLLAVGGPRRSQDQSLSVREWCAPACPHRRSTGWLSCHLRSCW